MLIIILRQSSVVNQVLLQNNIFTFIDHIIQFYAPSTHTIAEMNVERSLSRFRINSIKTNWLQLSGGGFIITFKKTPLFYMLIIYVDVHSETLHFCLYFITILVCLQIQKILQFWVEALMFCICLLYVFAYK